MQRKIHYGEPRERIFNRAQQDPLTNVLIVGRDVDGKVVGWTDLDEGAAQALLRDVAPELAD